MGPSLVGAGLATVACRPDISRAASEVRDGIRRHDVRTCRGHIQFCLSAAKLRAEAQRRGVEQQLRQSEERFRASSSGGRRDGEIGPKGNGCFATIGLRHPGLRTRGIAAEDVPGCDALRRSRGAHGGPPTTGERVIVVSKELRLIRSDGGIRWAGLYVSLVRDGTQYFIAVVEDMTDRVRRSRTAGSRAAAHPGAERGAAGRVGPGSAHNTDRDVRRLRGTAWSGAGPSAADLPGVA